MAQGSYGKKQTSLGDLAQEGGQIHQQLEHQEGDFCQIHRQLLKARGG